MGGSIPAFVDMMNARAQEIGCTDTHFENPHGLPNENHVTSAMDMAKITRTALENTAFKTIATTRRYTFPPTSSGEEAHPPEPSQNDGGHGVRLRRLPGRQDGLYIGGG